MALLAGVTVAAILARRRFPYLIVGWLWFLVMLLPMVGLVRVGITVVADRCTYLPQIGLAIALAWRAPICVALARRRRWIGGAIAGLVLMVAMVLAFRQTSYWCDSETLWKHTLRCTSQNAVAEMDFGDMLLEEGRYDEALVHAKTAMALLPNLPQPCFAMGRIAMFRGDFARAEEYLSLAVKNDPRFMPAYGRLGLLLYRRGRFNDAMSMFAKCVAGDPQNCEAWLDVGRCFKALGNTKDAKLAFQHVCAAFSRLRVIHYQAGPGPGRPRPFRRGDRELSASHRHLSRSYRRPAGTGPGPRKPRPDEGGLGRVRDHLEDRPETAGGTRMPRLSPRSEIRRRGHQCQTLNASLVHPHR